MTSTSLPQPTKDSVNFNIRVVTEEDKCRILEFFRKFFFKDEPLNKYLGLITEEKPVNEEVENFDCSDIGGSSLVAELNGQLIGVCINEIMEKGHIRENFEPTDKEFAKIVKFLEFIAKNCNPFQHFPGATKAMSLKIVSVDGSFRGKGIAKQLMVRTR